MATFDEIVGNRKDYPDEVKIDLGNGVVVTLGDVRGGYMKDADYRQKTSEVARQRRALDEETANRQAAFLEAEAKLAEWTKTLMSQNPGMTKTEAEEELEADPRYKRLMSKVESMESAAKESAKKIEVLEKTITDDQRGRMVAAHRQVLWSLKQADPELDTDALVEFAQSRGIPRLDDAYVLMNHGKLVDKEKKRAVEETVKTTTEKVKREMNQPVITGRSKVIKPAQDAPKTMDEAMEQALNDESIIAALTGSSGS